MRFKGSFEWGLIWEIGEKDILTVKFTEAAGSWARPKNERKDP
jgi:hypothetical protein